MGQAFRHQFWGEGSMTVDAAAVPVTRQGSDGDPYVTGRELVIVDVTYDSQRIYLPDQIRSGSLEGETVTIESDIAGASISTQEYLTSVASCGGKSVSVPMSPPICVPVTNDIVVHTGVIAEETEAGEMPIYYAGVSNTIQNSPTETETGRYRLTGEVVSTDEIDPSLEGGYALRVYDMDRVGDANIASSVTEDAGQFEERIKSQLELDESEWGTESSNEGGDNSGDEDGNDGESGNDKNRGTEPSSEDPHVKDTELRTDSVEVGESFDLWADVWNPGNRETETELRIAADGDVIETKTVTVGSVRSQMDIQSVIDQEGVYEITVNGHSAGQIDISESNESSKDNQSGAETTTASSGILGSDIGAILGVVSGAVFVLGVVLEGARGFKDRYGDTDPNLTEQMTAAIIVCASAGLVVSGHLIADGWGGFLLLFGGVGIVIFVGDYLLRSVLTPLARKNLNYEGRQSKAARVVGATVLYFGILALLTVLGTVLLPGSAMPLILQFMFAIVSVGIVLFGGMVGALRFYKKHLSDNGLNTAGNMGLAITFVGSLGVTTSGILGDIFGEGFILFGGLAFVGCFLVAIVKTIYQIV